MMQYSKHKKILLTIAGIVLLLGAAGALWQFASHTDSIEEGEWTYAGQFRGSVVEDGLKSFTSAKLDVSFQYPADYILFEQQNPESGPYNVYTIFISSEEPMLHSIKQARAGIGSESPPAVVFTFTQNVESQTLMEWLGSETGHSNYDPESDPTLTSESTTIDGIPAMKYRSDFGLRETDYVAFLYGDWIVLISASTAIDDAFRTVINSLQLTQQHE